MWTLNKWLQIEHFKNFNQNGIWRPQKSLLLQVLKLPNPRFQDLQDLQAEPLTLQCFLELFTGDSPPLPQCKDLAHRCSAICMLESTVSQRTHHLNHIDSYRFIITHNHTIHLSETSWLAQNLEKRMTQRLVIGSALRMSSVLAT